MGVLFGFGVLILPYLTGGMGAGDVKLLAGIGAWIGMPYTLYVFLASSLAAGAYALLLVIVRGRLHETWLNFRLIWIRFLLIGRHLNGEDRVEAQVKSVDRQYRLIPFAVMVAIGLAATLIWLRIQ